MYCETHTHSHCIVEQVAQITFDLEERLTWIGQHKNYVTVKDLFLKEARHDKARFGFASFE